MFELASFLIPKPSNNILGWDDFMPSASYQIISNHINNQILYLECSLILLQPSTYINSLLQYGCTKGHQALEMHILRTVLQFCNTWGKTVVIYSFDIWKAFDTLHLDAVFDLLAASSVPLTLRYAIMQELAVEAPIKDTLRKCSRHPLHSYKMPLLDVQLLVRCFSPQKNSTSRLVNLGSEKSVI